MGAGQFSIFGAVEEKGGRDFPESGGMKQRLSDASFLRWMAAVFVDMKRLEENLVEWAAGISTAGAQEMQKDSCQFLLSGLGCWVVGLGFRYQEASLIRRVACGLVAGWIAICGASLLGQTTAGTKVVVLRCGSLFDGRGDALRKNVVVVIEGEKIKEIATSAPGGAEVHRSIARNLSSGAD
jgi:hypothetical protein